jgi:hypothetical protein
MQVVRKAENFFKMLADVDPFQHPATVKNLNVPSASSLVCPLKGSSTL